MKDPWLIIWTGSSSRKGNRPPIPVKAANTDPIEFETQDDALRLLVEMTLSGDYEGKFLDELVVMRRSEVVEKWAGLLT